ncbi:hypothetical protein D3C76_910770 [compost metagenome]
MHGRQAIERLLQQRLGQRAPEYERRLHAPLFGVAMADGLPIAAIVQLCQASGEQLGATGMEIFVEQVHRPPLERVKKRARQWREDRRPAQQAEQRIDQAVLDVMHWRGFVVQVSLNVVLHR